jgi:hypothetical protein
MSGVQESLGPRNRWGPGIVGAQESLGPRNRWGPGIVGERFVDLPPGKTEGMSMMKSVCAAIGLATIAMLSIPLSLYGA